MDKLYKAHFLSQLKARMPVDLPDFALQKVPPTGHPLRARFAASKLYCRQLPSSRCVWLEWFPGEGVDREFFVLVGWSLSPQVLPTTQPGDMRIYEIHGPISGMECGALNVQQVEGRQVVEGFRIATPWDQLYKLSPRATDEERKGVMNKAHAEYLAVSDAERIEVVRVAMNEAFVCIRSILPKFTSTLEGLPSAA